MIIQSISNGLNNIRQLNMSNMFVAADLGDFAHSQDCVVERLKDLIIYMFDEYIGKQLKPRYKYIGLKYARTHRFPELISASSYGICFKDEDNEKGEREYLVFRVLFDSKPVYVGKRHVPGRAIKTITEIELFGKGYSSEEMEEAEKITRGYLEFAVEE